MAGKKAIKVKNDGGSPLPPMQALQEPLSRIMQEGPVSCELKPQFRQRIADLDHCLDYGVSPDRTKAFLTQVESCPLGGADRLIIDIWNLKTFTIEQQFSSEELAAYVSGSNCSEDGTAMNYRQACFIDNEHIAFCTMTGHLCLLSVVTGEVVLKKKVGDLLSTVASCLDKDIFAVSIFPRVGFDNEYLSACGIKMFSIGAFVEKQELELIEFISYGRGGESPFSVLPHRVNFSRSGERLLFRGAALRQSGCTDYIEVSDVSNRPAVTIHERDNDDQVVVADISANHHIVAIDCDSITFFDKNQNEINCSPLPQEFAGGNGCRNCIISDDGSKALAWLNGVVYLFAPGQEPKRCFAGLGYVLDVGWLGDEEVVAFVSQSQYDSYHICRIDLKSMAVTGSSIDPGKQRIEAVLPRAVAVSQDGRLFIGDRQANLRIYNPNLTLQKSLKMTSGAINQLAADRFQDRVAVLMASQELKILSPEDCDLKTYISRRTKKPVLAGSGVEYTYYPLMEGGELLFNFDRKSISLQCDGIRNLYIERGKKLITVYDGCGADKKIVGKYNFPAPVVAAADCHRHIIFAIGNSLGSMLVFDPYDFEFKEAEVENDEKLIKSDGKHLVWIAEGIERPLGLAAAGPGRVALWTENEVILFTLAADFSISRVLQVAQAGVKNIVYDNVNGRIILVKSHCLSFCAEDLKEMYRLSILSDGRSIIEVPYPEEAAQAHDLNHPGFVWSSDTLPPDPALFAVLDGNGQVVADDAKCRDFLETRVFNEFMVREATSDYPVFLKMLAGAGGETSVFCGSKVKMLGLPYNQLIGKEVEHG